ncbi:SusC/RagA family TonB-linked outer membrane protein [Sphingobacterium sp. SGG-5]|nr:SusC/RagA family TonB-linked outer membrane protein [Sphingobacterium sp. SGG-5]
MDKVLRGQKLTYKVSSETVMVTVRENVPTVEAKTIQNQITGVVQDDAGNPVAGASIIVKGTSAGTTTDSNGRFRIAAAPNSVLEIRFIGFRSEEINVGNKTEITVALREDDTAIEAVDVVATGYQNIDRKLFTGSTAKINAKDAERAGVPDISRMLEGQAAGVAVQNVSGTFGAAPKIRVRGATSLSGDNKPLWVIDGIILQDVVNISNEALSTGDANTLIGSSVAGLNPDDIESFTILKDAAATAMYGARAMNGVIVVTTKKGRNTDGKPNVNYSGTFTTYLKPNYNQFDIMNSAEQMSVMLEMENKGYFNHSATSRSANGGIFTKMYNLLYDYDEATDSFALVNTLEDRLNFLQRYARANTDWFDVLFKNSLMQEHSVSVSSGTARSQTYFSTSAMMDNGQTLGDNAKRYTANIRNNFKMNDRLSAEFLVNGSVRDQRTPGTLQRSSDEVFGAYSRDFDINPYSYALNTSRLITPYNEDGSLEYFTRNYAPFNIINELNTNYLKLTMLDLKVQVGLRYKIIPQLTYSIDGAYRYAKTERQHYVLDQSNMVGAFRAAGDATIAQANDFLYTDPDYPNSLPQIVLPEGGFYNTTLNNIKNFYMRHNVEYNEVFERHKLNLFGSAEVIFTDRQNSNYEGIGYQYGNGGLVNPNYRFFKKMIEGSDPYFGMGLQYDRFVATMGRAAYSYNDRYSVNATIRYDGSNQMGETAVARWLPTWNISGAWDIDQESFFNPEGAILSAMRLRGTYGLVASMGNANNSSTVFYNRITYRPYENEKEAMIYVSSLKNTELTWEKLYELNIGTDLALFNNKINITADWYRRNIFDLIAGIRTSGIGGQYTKQANAGEMKSRGFEFTVAGSPVKREGGFNWRTQLNFAVNKNKVTRLDVNQNIWTLVRPEGAPLEGASQRGLYSIQFAGLNPNYGYPTYIDERGDQNTYLYLQSTDIDYLKYHGPVDPTFTGGFYNQFRYKDFTLSTLLTFSTGNFVRMEPTYTTFYNDYTSMSKGMVNRWLMPGDENYTDVPAILDQFTRDNRVIRANGTTINPRYTYNAYNYSDVQVAKGDFVRLKNISLTYQIPARLAKRLSMSNAQISLVGNNVALLYSDKDLKGADPEFFNNGGVAMPIPRQYTFSLKMGF